MKPEERLIVALDVESSSQAEKLVRALTPLGIGRFKVGLELFTRAGPPIVEAVHRCGGRVFLDLKFHDIPNTVGRAVRAAVRLGVWMTNVHAQGGAAMMRQAADAAREEAQETGQQPPILIGVTVLTSLAQEETAEQVLFLAEQAKASGLNGVVASALEARRIRSACGEDFVIVTPGIRPATPSSADDQQRTASPEQAIRAGADYLVVGRPILKASDPVQAAKEILRAAQ